MAFNNFEVLFLTYFYIHPTRLIPAYELSSHFDLPTKSVGAKARRFIRLGYLSKCLDKKLDRVSYQITDRGVSALESELSRRAHGK